MKSYLLLLCFVSVLGFSQEGKIISKNKIDLSQTKLYHKLSRDGVLKKEYEYLNNINFFEISYQSDIHIVQGIVAEPNTKGKFPVILFNRGGNKMVGQKAKSATLFTLIVSSTAKLVNDGYVVVASCYREQDEFGGKDINDLLVLKKTINELEKADTTRIGMAGISRGGMMTYLSLKARDFLKTAVVINGPSNLKPLLKERPEMETYVLKKLVPDYNTNKEKELEKRSMVYWYDTLDKNSSLLILSGSLDKRVNPNQSKQAFDALKQINYNVKHIEFETNHTFSGKRQELYNTLKTWFHDNL